MLNDTKSEMVTEIETFTSAPPTKGALGKVARKKRVATPVHADPKAELRRLVNDHKNLTMKAKSIAQMCSDRVVRAGPNAGDKIPSGVPADRCVEMKAVASALSRDAKRLESEMLVALRQVPIYSLFLVNVWGLGAVVCAYLVAYIDITKATKISNLRRFVGLAVINGRLERPTRGQKLGYCAELRTRIYQGMSSMWKNSAKRTADRPNGSTTKYLDVWRNYKARMQHSERMLPNNRLASFVEGGDSRAGAKAVVHATGWHKAADVLIEDIYTVWRAAEGLPVWPSYYAAKLGYNHGGTIAVNAPKMLTVDEALAMVGNVDAMPASAPVEEIEMGEDEEPEV